MARTKAPKRPDTISHAPLNLEAMSGRWKEREDGTIHWYFRARAQQGGDRKTIPLGWFCPKDKAALHAAAAKLIADGAFAKSAPSVGRGPPKTVAELLAEWLAVKEKQVWRGDLREKPRMRRGITTPGTHEKYEYAAGHLVAWIGDVRLAEVTEEVLSQYVVDRRHNEPVARNRSRSDRTLHFEQRVLSFAWSWGRKRGWVSGEVSVTVHPDPDVRVNNHHNPDLEDVALVLDHLEGDYRVGVELWAWTGCRLSEIAQGVRLQDVDLDEGIIRVFGKGGVWRSFPIHPSHREEFAKRKAAGSPNDMLLRAPEKGVRQRTRSDGFTGLLPQTVRNQILAACKRAGVRPFTAHGIRRMVEDRLYERAGTDPSMNANIMGHSPEVAMKVYRKVRPEKKRIAMYEAGLGSIFTRRADDNVIQLPTSGGAGVDLSSVSMSSLLEELDRRQRQQPPTVDDSRDATPTRVESARGTS